MESHESLSSGWKMEEPEEGKYNFSDERGAWQPRPEDIMMILDKLEQAKGGPLPIKWICPGRRAPDKQYKQDNRAEDQADKDGEDSRPEELRAPEASAFDFDEFQTVASTKLTPRAVPGGRTPRTEKKVAKMEDIMNSLRKQHLQRFAEKEAKRKASLGNSPGRSRLLNFRTVDPKPDKTFSSGSKPETPKITLNESAAIKPGTSLSKENDSIIKSSVSKSLFTESEFNTELSSDTKSSDPVAEMDKPYMDINNLTDEPVDEVLMLSAESPPGSIQPVVTNLNDLMDPNSITVIAKPSMGSDSALPNVPSTVLNLEPMSTSDEDLVHKDTPAVQDIQQASPLPAAAAQTEHLAVRTSGKGESPETSPPVVTSLLTLSVSDTSASPANVTLQENPSTEGNEQTNDTSK
uniref:Uncharacterized protein n=1 Tax=Biomphalaria glabrata TaxID=6526 RepID=A0A2C9LNP5_BIOGL